MKKIHLILTVFLSLLLFAACSNTNSKIDNEEDENHLEVYTTVYPLQYLAEQIGGQYVKASSIYPAGVDAHTYEPTQKDMIDFAHANLFFYIGHGLEGFAKKAESALKNEKVKLIAAGEKLDSSKLNINNDDGHSSHSDIDPHIWIDPILAIDLAEIIKDELVKEKKEEEQYFTSNFEQVKEKLLELDQQFKNIVANSRHNKILVAHAAYGYWEKRYGIEQISISGLSTTNEPSQKQLEQIVEAVRENKLNYILFEQNNRPRIASIIQTETKTEPLTIHNLSVLTEEDLKNEENYVTIMEQNLAVLSKVLQDE